MVSPGDISLRGHPCRKRDTIEDIFFLLVVSPLLRHFLGRGRTITLYGGRGLPSHGQQFSRALLSRNQKILFFSDSSISSSVVWATTTAKCCNPPRFTIEAARKTSDLFEPPFPVSLSGFPSSALLFQKNNMPQSSELRWSGYSFLLDPSFFYPPIPVAPYLCLRRLGDMGMEGVTCRQLYFPLPPHPSPFYPLFLMVFFFRYW